MFDSPGSSVMHATGRITRRPYAIETPSLLRVQYPYPYPHTPSLSEAVVKVEKFGCGVADTGFDVCRRDVVDTAVAVSIYTQR